MNYSTVQLLDLPDKMLIEIFNKLTRVDVLYSILGVNKRLNRLVCDPTFTHFLDLTIKASYDERHSLPDVILDRFCLFILPRIHNNIQSLRVEPSSMERILLICNYPKLHKLILNSIKPEAFLKYLADDSTIVHIFKRITHLEVSTIEYYSHMTIPQMDLNKNGYARLFSVCQHLSHLNINGKYLHLDTWMRQNALPLTMCSSSIIVELNVNVNTIDDCLRLLDGRFSQMKILNITIDSIEATSLNIANQNSLPNLTTFGLFSTMPTEEYDNLIVPLLRRMPNIEELTLCLDVENRSKFIDGAVLHKDILIHMPRINIFLFNIITIDHHVDLSYWFKNDDIEETYIINDGHPYIYCRVDFFTNGIGRFRIASYPFNTKNLNL
ncbi:unnamed protein product [Rotaria sordida]|uniref:F-box domain-containing protein n=1 Tax=Rotaria sordida TaxID=392033 RepID=A0A814L265_9BILA|nr:unnamed protein product [Rotaria sordida]CAF3757357.1 unnamed protein product [Rotaria sordida]